MAGLIAPQTRRRPRFHGLRVSEVNRLTDDAVALIRQIREKDGLSEPMRRRLSEMMITLGVDPEPVADLPGGVPATMPAG